ncbi:CHRNA10 [Branchiostoma lanceolatum]|uniref:CHRNA10 protein n=1 Tax=Branchiostoma lanceolatum TaxID=7740 RepID=A0A8J9ZE78_BRALA|nr:CHRNA10 [Branchiostoma lanceolatum]
MFFCISLGLLLLTTCEMTQGVYEAELIQTLLKDYSTDARPVKDASTTVTVAIDVIIAQILEVHWVDEYLTWNVTKYGGIESIHTNSENIWRPDIVVYNRIQDEGFSSTPDTNAEVFFDGRVNWFHPVTVRSTCLMDVSRFPYDIQRCPLTLGSWTYSNDLLDIEREDNPGSNTESEYTENGEWILLSVKAEKGLINTPTGAHTTVTWTVEVARRALYYNYYVLATSFVLVAVGLLTFSVPADSLEKLSLSIVMLLSLIVFMGLVIESLPATSFNIPLIGQFFGAMIVLIALSAAMTIFILGLHYRGPQISPVPNWLRKLCRLENKTQLPDNEWVLLVLENRKKKPKKPTLSSATEEEINTLVSHKENLEGIADNIDYFMGKYEKKEKKREMEDEWQQLAIIFDRLPAVCRTSILEATPFAFQSAMTDDLDTPKMSTKVISLTVLCFACLLSFVVPKGTGGTVPENVLITKLLENYSTDARPVLNSLDTTTVHFDIVIAQILELNAKEQVLTSNVWIRQRWVDEVLTWKPEENGNITVVHINSENIWRPDTILYNRLHDEGWSATPDTNAIIEHTGEVFWPYPVTVRSSCILDVSLFPFDVQRCPLEFGSWTYHGGQINLLNVSAGGVTEEFIENGEWILRSFEADRHVHRNISGKPFPTIEYTVEISRRTLYYIYYVVAPSFLLALLALLGFYLPSDSGEKLSLSITMLLALIVFMQLVTEKLPPISTSIPLIGKFFGGVIVLVTLSSAMTIFVLSLHYRGPKIYPIPQWVRKVFFLGPTKLGKVKVITNPGAHTVKMNGVPGETTSSNPEAQTLSRTLARIEQSISHFVEDHEKKSQYIALEKEWKFLAKRIDRCLLAFFMVALVIMTITVLLAR